MIDLDIKRRKTSLFLKNLNFLEKMGKKEFSDFNIDYQVILATKHAIQELVQICIDFGFHICSINKFTEPINYKDVFNILNENDIIDKPLAKKMGLWAGMRNIITHMYDQVDNELLFASIKNDLDDFTKFLNALSKLDEISMRNK